MNKKLLLFIPIFSLLIAGCNSGGDTSSAPSTNSATTAQPSGTTGGTSGGSGTSGTSGSTSAPITKKYQVRFLSEGVVLKTMEVLHGEKAVAPSSPTKAPDAEAFKYVFAGWDRDLDIPITRDVDFHALFDAYAEQILIDDFESYTVDNELADEGWVPIGYNGGWTEDTSASLSLTKNAADGNQALRFDCYKNDTPFMIRKKFEENNITKCANAIKFKMMTPKGANISRFLLTVPLSVVPVPGATSDPVFKHDFPVTTASYFECTIPFAADGWKLWEKPINVREDAAALGFNCDILPTLMNKIDICLSYPSHSPSNYLAFLDSVSFVTIDEDITDVIVNEYFELADEYTGKTLDGHTMKIDVLDSSNGSATASIIDLETPIVVNGTVSAYNNEFTFASTESGKLTYVGRLTNGGQKVTFVSATGELASSVSEMTLDSVQVVDNFEQYEEDGEFYRITNQETRPAITNEESDRRGCRGAYYAEFYDGGEYTVDDKPYVYRAPFGGNKWSLMRGDGNQLSLQTGGGHSGDNYLQLKRSSKVMRYMQWDLFKGTSDSKAYRGTTFSFWAKASGQVSHFKMSFYSQSCPDNQHMEERVKILDSYDAVPTTDWTHYTIKLDPEQVYYGFMISLYEGSDTAYLLLDDLEVYTANPYSTCVTGVSLSKSSVSLGVGYQEELIPTFEPFDAGLKSITWTSSDDDVATVDKYGVVTAISAGSATITATTVDGGFEATCAVTVTAAGSNPIGTYKGTVLIGEGDDQEQHDLVISLGLSTKGSLAAVVLDNVSANAFAQPTFNTTTKEMVITTSGSFDGKTFGNVTLIYDQVHNRLTSASFGGELGEVVTNNGEITLYKLTTFECDGTNAELQKVFRRRYKYNYGAWTVDTSNTDRIARNGSKYVTGTGAARLRAYQGTGNAVGISMLNEYQTAKKYSNIQFWVYNPGESNINLKIWVYKGNNYTSAIEATTETQPAIAINRNDTNPSNNYVYISIRFPATDIYNWQISDMNGSADPLSFDNIVLF